MNFVGLINIFIILNHIYIVLTASYGHNDVEQGRVTGGHEAKAHSHPYIVSLQTKFLWVRLHVCGGSILTEDWVLTAAHCIKESWLIRLLYMDAVAGAHDINNFGSRAQVVSVDQRIAHPSYPGGIGAFDIAVLRTKTKFTFNKYVRPLNLPTRNFKIDDKKLMLSGWGALRTTVFIPDFPSRLQELQVKYLPYKECYEAIEDVKGDDEDNPLDGDAHICTGPISGGMAACSGDSGGPLVQMIPKYKLIPYDDVEELTLFDEVSEKRADNINETVPVVLGVVSWGFSPCGAKGTPSVYTKVSQYIDFIEEYVKL